MDNFSKFRIISFGKIPKSGVTGARVYIFFWLLLHVIRLLSQKVLKVKDFYVLRPSDFSFLFLLSPADLLYA